MIAHDDRVIHFDYGAVHLFAICLSQTGTILVWAE